MVVWINFLRLWNYLADVKHYANIATKNINPQKDLARVEVGSDSSWWEQLYPSHLESRAIGNIWAGNLCS